MSESLGFGVFAFTSLLSIVNPLAAVPIYVGMTSNYDARQRRITVRRASITGLLILVAFTAFGPLILRFFGITTEAFQIAGGIIFFGIGWEMLHARSSSTKTSPAEQTAGASKEDIGIIPLGLPTLVGPGAITTVIALNGQAGSAADIAFIYIAIVTVMLISAGLLASAPFVTRRVGTTGMNLMTRLMGLIVMVVGAQFEINGITAVARGLGA